MNLEQYLEGIRNCPDEIVRVGKDEVHRLTAEFGVYDNFPIKARGDIQVVDVGLQQSENYDREIVDKLGGGRFIRFTHKITRIKPELFHSVGQGFHPWAINSDNITPEEQEFLAKQRSNYNMRLMLNMPDGQWSFSMMPLMAKIIDDVINLLSKQKIPFCLPQSFGWRYYGKEDHPDLSRIVYYDPEQKNENEESKT